MEDWKEYAQGAEVRSRDLSVFPWKDLDSEEHLRRRFRWLCKILPGRPVRHFEIWQSVEDSLILEAERWKKKTPFLPKSFVYPYFLAQQEVFNLKLLKSLHHQLRLFPLSCPNVLLMGPTFGGEIEAIEASGCMPWFEASWLCKWAAVAEERLAHDSVIYKSFSLNPDTLFPVVVISPYEKDPAMWRKGYNFLERSGFILSFPTKIKGIEQEFEALGMKNESETPNLGVWCKKKSLPMTI